MVQEVEHQAVIDQEHLKLLALGYFIMAGVTAFFSLFALLYVAMGAVIGFTGLHAHRSDDRVPPALFGLIFAGIGLLICAMFLGGAILKFFAARNIKRRKSRTFCMVVAGLSCLEIPYGTALGVATFMVLGRKSVRDLFEANAAQTAPNVRPV